MKIYNINFPIYMTMILLSILLAFIFIGYNLKKNKVPNNIILLSLFMNICFIFVGGKYYSIFTSSKSMNFIEAPLSSYGGAIGLLLSMFIFNKIYDKHKKLFNTLYIMVLPLIYGISKLGCFFVGCCNGIKYDGLFNVIYVNKDNISLFPVQLVETITFVIIFIIGCILYKKKKDYIISYTIISSALLKFILDYFRESHNNIVLSTNQIVSIIFIIVTILIIIRKRLVKN